MKANKKTLSILLAMMIASNSTLSFAATFKDMKDAKGKDHWSLPYVTDISSKNLVGGYSDGTFKPNKPVTRIESVVFISRLFPVQTVKATYEANKAKWEAKMKEHIIPDFAKSAVVFGLENGWYSEAYLKEFMNKQTKAQKEAQRYEFSVYLVRALGWDKEMSNAAVVSYKDAKNIPKQAVPFIDILGKKGVVVTTGEFNPLKSVTRGEVAKMLSVSYPHSQVAKGAVPTTQPQQPQQPQQPTKPQQPGVVTMPSGTVVEGKIKQISIDNFNIILIITDKAGNLTSYTNRTNGVVISLDGRAADANALKEGYGVKLYTEGTTLKGVEAVTVNQTNVNKDLLGEVVSVDANLIKIRNGNVVEEYRFANNATFTKNGKSARALDLIAGDSVTAKIQNSLVVSIEAKTVRRTLKNVVIKGITSYSNGTASIIITDEKGNNYTMEFTAASTAYLNNKKVSLSSISVGYEADIYANSNEILDITLYGEARGTVITGVISDLNLRDDIIYVKKADGKEVKVIILRNAEIIDQLTNRPKSVDSLSKNDNVIINGFEGINTFEATRIAFYR